MAKIVMKYVVSCKTTQIKNDLMIDDCTVNEITLLDGNWLYNIRINMKKTQ